MIASAHLAAGAVSGAIVCGPNKLSFMARLFLASVFGLLSHVLLDYFPHGEYGPSLHGWDLMAILLFEIMIVSVLMFDYRIGPNKLAVRSNIFIFIAMFWAAFPDILTLASRYVFYSEFLNSAGHFLHLSHGKMPGVPMVGVITQVLLSIGAIVFVRFRLTR